MLLCMSRERRGFPSLTSVGSPYLALHSDLMKGQNGKEERRGKTDKRR